MSLTSVIPTNAPLPGGEHYYRLACNKTVQDCSLLSCRRNTMGWIHTALELRSLCLGRMLRGIAIADLPSFCSFPAPSGERPATHL